MIKISKNFLLENITSKTPVKLNIKNDKNINVPINVLIFDVELKSVDQGIGSYEYGGVIGHDVDIQLELDGFEYSFYDNQNNEIDSEDYYNLLVKQNLWKNEDFNGFLFKVEASIEDYIYDNEDKFLPEKDEEIPEEDAEAPYNWG